MTNDNHIHKRLDQLFALAKQQEPLLENKYVHELITNAPAKACPGKQLVNYVKRNLKSIIMTTIVSSILISAVLWVNTSQKPEVASSSTIKNDPPVVEVNKKISENKRGVIVERVKNEVKDSASLSTNENVLVAKREISNGKVVNETSISSDTVKTVINSDYSTKFIELGQKDLERLGFRFHSKGITYDNAVYEDNFLHLWFNYDGTCGVDFKDSAKLNLNFFPEFVSYIDGTLPLSWGFQRKVTRAITNGIETEIDSLSIKYGGNQKDFNTQTNKLVPIIIKNELLQNYKSDLIFWFRPTRAFFDSLPSSIGNEIRKEYYKSDISVKRKINVVPKAKQASTSCNYFKENCSTLVVINSMIVYPNPATDNINVDITLTQPAELSFALYDIGGRLLEPLKSSMTFDTGQHHLSFPLGFLKKGIYILVVRDKNGNSKQQRIIKQ